MNNEVKPLAWYELAEIQRRRKKKKFFLTLFTFDLYPLFKGLLSIYRNITNFLFQYDETEILTSKRKEYYKSFPKDIEYRLFDLETFKEQELFQQRTIREKYNFQKNLMSKKQRIDKELAENLREIEISRNLMSSEEYREQKFMVVDRFRKVYQQNFSANINSKKVK